MTQINNTGEYILNLIQLVRSQAEQFFIVHSSELQTFVIQATQRLGELEAENESLRNQVSVAEGNLTVVQNIVNERDNSLVTAANQIAELNQRLADLNSAIDAAQQV
jgi:chromosome segregation ATPase